MSTADGPLAALLACVHGLPDRHVRTLIALLEQFPTAAEARRAVVGAVPSPVYRQQASQLLDAWARLPACSGSALALALETALALREQERDAEVVELVASGPTSPHISLRHTKAVLLELVDRAQRELIVVTYVAYRVPDLVSALERAHRRAVVVRLILESTADSGGALTHDGAAAFESLRGSVELYVWPLRQRPSGARLHAKTAVADSELAFVTSANLTGHALDQNLEVGVLVRGGPAPQRLMEHFQALIAKGTLTRL